MFDRVSSWTSSECLCERPSLSVLLLSLCNSYSEPSFTVGIHRSLSRFRHGRVLVARSLFSMPLCGRIRGSCFGSCGSEYLGYCSSKAWSRTTRTSGDRERDVILSSQSGWSGICKSLRVNVPFPVDPIRARQPEPEEYCSTLRSRKLLWRFGQIFGGKSFHAERQPGEELQ